MKKIHSIYILAFFMILFNSCEKGIDMVDFDSTVYLPQNGLSTHAVFLGESVFELGVYKAGINQLNANVDVNVKIDNEAFTEFLIENPGFELLPEAYYNIESSVMQIPKGSEREFFKIQIKSIDESFVDKKYILPVSIKSASVDSVIFDEKSTAFLNFDRYKNVYEALYKANGQYGVSGSEDAKGIIDKKVTSISTSANSIRVNSINSNINLDLTIEGNNVTISGAPGFESLDIKNTEGKTSSYNGEFDKVYQANKGTFMLYYSYTSNGEEFDAEAELKFWL